jgi:CRP-like cAMP-binding protein
MFGHLPVPVVERLARHCVPVEFGPGEPVIRQGDQAEHFFVIESGQLAVMVDGQPRSSLGPGDAFGEIALMRAVQRTASVTAETDVRLWILDRATFLAAIAGSRRAEMVAERIADTRLAATDTTRAEERNYRNRRR